MKKTIYSGLIFIVIIILLTVSVTSCNNEALEFHQIMLLGDSCGIFDSSVRSIDILGTKYHDENAEANKSIELLNGSCVDLQYVESVKTYRKDSAIYNSANGNISCRYDSKSNLLTQISFEKNTLSVPNDITTESNYRNWIKKLLNVYGVKNLFGYKYACETIVTTADGNSLHTDQYSYFYTDLALDEEITSYVFTYTKYFAGYPTTDQISVNIFVATGAVTIKFDERKFTDAPKVNIDNSTIDTALNTYVISSLNADKYQFKSMQVMNKTLTRIENEICLIVDVEMDFVDKQTQSTMGYRTILLLSP